MFATCALAPGVAVAGTLDQQQTDGTAGGISIHSTSSHAQTFTAGLSGGLDQVDLQLQKVGSPTAPLSVEIRDVSGGAPGGVMLASYSVQAGSVPSAPAAAFLSLNFAAPVPVLAGTQYAIVAYSATVFPNRYEWYISGTNPYAGGANFFTTTSPPLGGWLMDAAADLTFRTYVVPTPGPTGQRAAALKKCKKKKKSKKARKKCRRRAAKLPV